MAIVSASACFTFTLVCKRRSKLLCKRMRALPTPAARAQVYAAPLHCAGRLQSLLNKINKSLNALKL